MIIDSFVVVFGGLNSQRNSLISNDIYVLCLDGQLDRIFPASAIKIGKNKLKKVVRVVNDSEVK